MPARTVFTVLEEAAARLGDAPALHQPSTMNGRRQVRTWSWREYRQAVEEIAAGLRRVGIQKGDIVALVCETRAEFYLADLGIMANGSVSAALYTSYPIAEQARTLCECDARAVFVEDARTLARLRSAAESPLAVYWILLAGETEGALTLEELRGLGRAALASDSEFFARICADVSPADPAILYLTSGATGTPKMGVVSHAALVANIDMGPTVLGAAPPDCMLAFLPSAHITQRVVVELLPLSCGISVWFSESLMRLPEELRSVKPTIFIAPPRLWERVHASICVELSKRPLLVRKVFEAALRAGRRAVEFRQARKPVPPWASLAEKAADWLVLRKVRARFGGRTRICASGSAPLGKELALFYMSIGLPLIEGYGLTEGGVLVMNPLDDPRPGSIGKPLPGVEARLASDGELLFRSPTLFSGYYRDPKSTAQVLRGGWLSTGDTAEFDPDGFIYITGRKKELIITSNGKKVFPSRIETLFKLEPVVSNVLLAGDRMPFITALITVNPTVAESFKGMEAWRGKPLAEIASAPPVIAEVGKAVARVNRQLAHFEQIRRFRVLSRDFSIDDGELTATLKLRRARALENFYDAVQEMYAGREQPA